MKKEIPWELIISDLKQDISDADKKHLEEWVSIDENRKVYEELRGVWEKVRAKVINYTPDVDFYWKELMQRMEEGNFHILRFRHPSYHHTDILRALMLRLPA